MCRDFPRAIIAFIERLVPKERVHASLSLSLSCRLRTWGLRSYQPMRTAGRVPISIRDQKPAQVEIKQKPT